MKSITKLNFDGAFERGRGAFKGIKAFVVSCLGLTFLPAYFFTLGDAAAGTWVQVGSMSVARQLDTATLLPDGRVLVAGGYFMSSAEIFDPGTARWGATGLLTTNRYQSTATLLPSGKVLIAGGSNYRNLPNAELFDPATSTSSATGSMTTGHDNHTATLLLSGKVLVAGGFSGTVGEGIATAELYDPAKGTWTAISPMRSPRFFHTATLLQDGKVLVAGGVNGDATIGTAELYDPTAGTWTLINPMSTNRSQHTATLLPNGKVLVAGGGGSGTYSSAELFDPATGVWSLTGPMNIIRLSHTATLLQDGRVLVAGGWNPTPGASAAEADTELYDPGTGTWSDAGSLPVPCYSHTATLLGDGSVLVAGGSSLSGVTNSAQVFLPALPVLGALVSAGNLILTWPATNLVSFHLQTTVDLSNHSWTDAGCPVTTTNGVSQATIPVGQGSGFYRLKY
jgi:N-acetylneuraminic acid mutarotase